MNLPFKPLANPVMIVSDNPALPGGLSRMCRDLAMLACTLPQYRVAVLGRGTGQNRKLPFITYDYPELSGGWGEHYIKGAWEDFSGGESGVILTLDDASRRHWMVNPTGLPEELAQFLGTGRNYYRWMYLPLDSTGPNGRTLGAAATDCVLRYDRVLAATEWGQGVLRDSGRVDADWLPHGYWPEKFHLHTQVVQCRMHTTKSAVGWEGDDVHVGCVMANQSRKDYPAAFECFAALKREYGNRFKAWLHTDAMVRYWNVYALATDYGVGDCIEVTLGLNDVQLASRYAACDCTILPTAGEGFGYPIMESLACGTACVTTDYAGGAALVEALCRVSPVAYRVDTQHNVLRAVLSGYAFAQKAKHQIELKRQDWEFRSGQLAQTAEHLQWPRLRHLWSKWLTSGLTS